MKNIFKYSFIILLLCLMCIVVNAETKECTYQLSYTSGSDKLTDEITFYLDPGVGIKDEFKIKSTNKKYNFSGAFGVPKGKIFNDKDFYIDDKATIEYAFYNSENKIVSSCPSAFSYIDFGTGGSLFKDGYIFCNFNYHTGAEGVLIKGSITQVKNNSNSSEDKSNQRKNCGSSFVFPLNSTKNASEFEGYSLMGQYYIENNTKYIEIKLKKGKEERDSTFHALMPTVGSTLEIDYFQKNYGGLPIKVETFDKCDSMPQTKTCEVFDSNTKIFIGSDCSNEYNGDTDTEKSTETKEEYEENYESKYGSYNGTLTTQGFGEGGQSCIDVVGENLSKMIKLSINVLRIAGAIIAIIKGMTLLIPPIMDGDKASLQKAGKKCIKLGIILLIIGVFPTIIRFMGYIFKYDLSCIFNI